MILSFRKFIFATNYICSLHFFLTENRNILVELYFKVVEYIINYNNDCHDSQKHVLKPLKKRKIKNKYAYRNRTPLSVVSMVVGPLRGMVTWRKAMETPPLKSK